MAGFSTVVSATNMNDERIIVYVAGDQVVQTKQRGCEVTIVVRPAKRQRRGWVGEERPAVEGPPAPPPGPPSAPVWPVFREDVGGPPPRVEGPRSSSESPSEEDRLFGPEERSPAARGVCTPFSSSGGLGS